MSVSERYETLKNTLHVLIVEFQIIGPTNVLVKKNVEMGVKGFTIGHYIQNMGDTVTHS